MRSSLTIITLLFCQIILGQTLAPKELIDGKKYYIHTAEKGTTLYGLQRMYDVPVESIVSSNPGIDKGVSIGQKIRIPVPLITVAHEVKKNETLYGISRIYDVTVDAIILANPASEQGLKIGQKLTVPNVDRDLVIPFVAESIGESDSVSIAKEIEPLPDKVILTDSIIVHTVLPEETLYSISKRFMVPVEQLKELNGIKSSQITAGDQLKIPVSKEPTEKVEIRAVPDREIPLKDSVIVFPKKERYKIAVLLPFNLEKGASDPHSVVSVDFLMGVELALDSLRKIGLSADVFVHDTGSDTLSLENLLTRPEFLETDLIIGSLKPDATEYIARWCRKNGVRMVCPAGAGASILKDNPYVYRAVSSDFMLMQGLAGHVLTRHSKEQILLVKTDIEKDAAIYEAFRNAFTTLPCAGVRPKLIEVTSENYTSFLKRGTNTVIICPSTDKNFALKFNTGLNKVAGSSVMVYGMKEWLSIEDLPLSKAGYGFGFCTSNNFNNFSYTDPKVISLHKRFRSKFKADMSRYSVHGFDVAYFFISQLLLEKNVKTNVLNVFDMKQVGLGQGYDNQANYVLVKEEGKFVIAE